MIDWPKVQTRLGVKADGQFGPISYAALLGFVAGRKVDSAIGTALAINAAAYGIDANSDRLSGFVGQCCHESARFTRMEEMGGTAYFTRLYGGRQDLGNTQPGDGARFHGRGILQLTGRANYRSVGAELGLDLIANPTLAASPSVAVLTALVFWKHNALNAICDARDWVKLTHRINGGSNGLDERLAFIAKAEGVLT